MPKLIVLSALSLRTSPILGRCLSDLTAIQTRKVISFKCTDFVFVVAFWTLSIFWLVILFILLYYHPSSWCLVGKAPATTSYCLITHCCSCTWKALKSVVTVILVKSLVFSMVLMDASNHSGPITSIFLTFLESLKVEPNNLMWLSMLRRQSLYCFMVSLSFSLSSSNSRTKFSTCILWILSSPSYSVVG